MQKRRTLACLLIVAAGLPIGLWATRSVAQARPTESKPNDIFKEIIPSLLEKTRVPLRLPEYVPYAGDKETPLYVILDVAEAGAYSIQLAWAKDCEGGNACHVGYVGGSKTRAQPSDKPEVPVMLTGGIKGSFVNFDCGAHCDDAVLSWNEGEYFYEISLKAGDKKTLIRMANSAIRIPAK